MIPTYTEDCPQLLFENDWWEETDTPDLTAGRLVKAFVPFVDQVPKALVAKGRTQAREHSLADCEIIHINSDRLFARSTLPVAALPCHSGEVRAIYNAKKRPALILSPPCEDVHDKCLTGKPRNLSSPTVLVAPYYGRDEGTGRRAGFSQSFADRVATCEWPQFFWDKLPLDSPETKESILRLDHLHPMSTHYIAYEPTPWRLCQDATDFMHEYATWYLTGKIQDHATAQLPLIRDVLFKP